MAEPVLMENVSARTCTMESIVNINVSFCFLQTQLRKRFFQTKSKIGKVEVSIGYLWIVYVVLLLAIIGFGAGAYLLYRKVATAPVPEQPLTAQREEERKILPAEGVFGETPEEYENQPSRWTSENIPPAVQAELDKDAREVPFKEEVAAAPAEDKKDQPLPS